ncbi:biotin/lipoyl-binding carrier protein [Oceanobacillus salinisoli]|uniref:biotin/lipoyl-binding carrier protein n=1 Tax=Oceanobacillus salinisoli TaxID=2678611 RepID=UPI0012E211ED|nr:biotin/lipoyl-binding carrier protein [Oceanobacillus salinisoli]
MAQVVSEMSGSVWKVEVKENEAVKAGDVLVILESMKMEIPIESTEDGVVTSLKVGEGDFVQEGGVVAVVSNG